MHKNNCNIAEGLPFVRQERVNTHKKEGSPDFNLVKRYLTSVSIMRLTQEKLLTELDTQPASVLLL